MFGHVQGMSYICEKFRNEKFRNMQNPFRYGTVVDGEHFIDRFEELGGPIFRQPVTRGHQLRPRAEEA